MQNRKGAPDHFQNSGNMNNNATEWKCRWLGKIQCTGILNENVTKKRMKMARIQHTWILRKKRKRKWLGKMQHTGFFGIPTSVLLKDPYFVEGDWQCPGYPIKARGLCYSHFGWPLVKSGTAKMLAVWGAVCFRSSSERAVTDVRDGPLRWTFETNGTDSSRRLLQKSIRAGRGGGPWTDGRDGPPGRTFETNGTDSWRRLLQKFVRAGRGRPAVTGRREGLLKQTARIPGADCCRSLSERAVGAGRGRPAVTGRRNGLLKQTARIPGADCCRSSSERAVAAGRGRPVVTGHRDGLLKQTARIPGADCFRSPS